MEDETQKAEISLAVTVNKLAQSSKQADCVLKKVKAVEGKVMNNEVRSIQTSHRYRNKHR
jgi:hypothetical protein